MDKLMRNLIKILLIMVILIIFFYLFSTIKNVIILILTFLLPFIIGFTIAFLLTPIVDYLESIKLNRKVVSFIILGLFIGLIILLFIFVVPLLVDEITKLINNFPEYFTNVLNIIKKIALKFNINVNVDNVTFDKILSIVGSNYLDIFGIFGKIIQGTFSYLFIGLLSLILSLYFLIDYHIIINKFKEYLVKKQKENLFCMFRDLKKNMYSYLFGLLLVMIFLVIISSLSFWILGIGLPLLWGLIIGITNIIPYIGPYIGGFIVVLFTLGSCPDKVVYVITTIVVIQLLESNFITPKVESKTVKVHPILAIFSVTLLGELLGIFGMILAIPLISSIQIIKNRKKNN